MIRPSMMSRTGGQALIATSRRIHQNPLHWSPIAVLLQDWVDPVNVLAWVFIIFGLLIGIPAMLIFPPIGVVFMLIAFGGYVLRQKTRGIRMRRQQGRGWLDW